MLTYLCWTLTYFISRVGDRSIPPYNVYNEHTLDLKGLLNKNNLLEELKNINFYKFIQPESLR